MGNFTFTLYEVFGYLLPGGVTLIGFVVLYWASFMPGMPLGIASFQAGPVTWVSVSLASYLLGHAWQAIGNLCFHGVEDSLLSSQNGSAPAWMRERARLAASEFLKVNPDQLDPRWIFSALDEYTVQIGKIGDRDLFVYREGFYRATALSLFFLSATLFLRTFVPGASIMFTKGLFHVPGWEAFVTAVLISGAGYLFVRRYKRFAEYRVTHAVLSALVMSSTMPSTSKPSQVSQPRPTESNGKATLP